MHARLTPIYIYIFTNSLNRKAKRKKRNSLKYLHGISGPSNKTLPRQPSFPSFVRANRRSFRPSRFVSVATGGIFLASRWRCTWVIRNERRAVESLGRDWEILWPTAHVYSFLSSVWHRDSRRAILTRQRHCVCVGWRVASPPIVFHPWNDDRPWSCVISGTPWNWDHSIEQARFRRGKGTRSTRRWMRLSRLRLLIPRVGPFDRSKQNNRSLELV